MVFKRGRARRGGRMVKRRRRIHRFPSNALSQYRVKIVCTFGLTSTSTNPYAIAFPLNYPSMNLNNSGTYSAGLNACTQLARLMATFDVYQVEKMVVRWSPSAVDVTYNATGGDTPLLYHFIDEDDCSTNLTLNGSTNGGLLPHSYADGRDVTFTMKQFAVHRKDWLNCSTYQQLPASAPANNGGLPFANSFASMKCFFPSLLTTLFYGTFVVEHYVHFRGNLMT